MSLSPDEFRKTTEAARATFVHMQSARRHAEVSQATWENDREMMAKSMAQFQRWQTSFAEQKAALRAVRDDPRLPHQLYAIRRYRFSQWRHPAILQFRAVNQLRRFHIALLNYWIVVKSIALWVIGIILWVWQRRWEILRLIIICALGIVGILVSGWLLEQVPVVFEAVRRFLQSLFGGAP